MAVTAAMQAHRHLVLAVSAALLAPGIAHAQLVSIEPIAPVEETDRIEIEPVPTAADAIWMAGLQGGLIDRDGGANSPYATFSLTRYRQQTYLRAALTVYRSTLRQVDTPLPSTYYIGSIGAGGNFNDWVLDAHVSYGQQRYGLIRTAMTTVKSDYASTNYVAAGVSLGRVIRPAAQLYLTPTVEIEYVDTKSLHHGFDLGRPVEIEVAEHIWTGAATLRLDRTFGAYEQNYFGIAASHHRTNTGLTQLYLASPGGIAVGGVTDSGKPFAPPPEGGDVVGGAPAGLVLVRTPDNWQELEASGTIQLSRRLWLDGQLQRSFGAIAGDSTRATLGFRLRF
ncbi:autotransporter outer membrane beta-barrel domain-containing protein [Novosphingobium sp. JCM 18896]|uniref:autotransporter outer membrane beta-barrel domain-containing protein n=1 Tax=Novosphingobium sp. JCM 18896 TaxID=2989731 RepID=UPI002221CE76|nr:autotransporter outer membrane beta-barrel domain-containing protein [Novosphingobium sp. JCM 18896]MCW1428888.1 autotransporter outer membrane beta-barrel domain-containing protein [Novosphingobium sp. JCM 18896]